MASYDANNIFAKILRGELPAFKIYEDDKTFAFLDIMPRHDGVPLLAPASRREDMKVLEDHTNRIIAALKN
jgi:histidine triad (HIT) family protein